MLYNLFALLTVDCGIYKVRNNVLNQPQKYFNLFFQFSLRAFCHCGCYGLRDCNIIKSFPTIYMLISLAPKNI